MAPAGAAVVGRDGDFVGGSNLGCGGHGRPSPLKAIGYAAVPPSREKLVGWRKLIFRSKGDELLPAFRDTIQSVSPAAVPRCGHRLAVVRRGHARVRIMASIADALCV